MNLLHLQGRSGLAFKLAALGTLMFALLVFLFNIRFAFREPILAYGFPLNALIFHVGLGVAIWAMFGDAEKRGPNILWAAVANVIPVILFWWMVYGIITALRNFT